MLYRRVGYYVLSKREMSSPTSALYLVPDQTCPLFDMNSSAGYVEMENLVVKTTLKPSRDDKIGENGESSQWLQEEAAKLVMERSWV